MLRQVTDSVRSGRTAVVFSNDDLAFEMFRRRGKAEEDIYNYTLIGCYEPSILGREMCCSMSAWGSLVKPLEAVFNNGCAFTGERLGPEYALQHQRRHARRTRHGGGLSRRRPDAG